MNSTNDEELSTLSDIFGSNVFNDAVMRRTLPKETYRSLRQTIEDGTPLDPQVADVVASVMKDWAIGKGATHFTHWFQPMTGLTAEKHDSFISPTPDGRVILDFSGKELIKGEPDASSFPSGGLRATFEARGYTAWDITSPAFVKDGSLYIPTAFASYNGEALDQKTPLLRSMDALSTQAMRILRLLGNTTSRRVTTTVGPEQEYFVIDKDHFDQREDLIITGRTLFGAPAPKGQELEDQYFAVINDRITAFMADVDTELWKLGVSAKTKHNEVAPAQHELAPIFATANIATDHNHLMMETMRKVALRHGLVCLLHEKPFAGINGSGKHNNWSMATDDGHNLLEPGQTPHDNIQFLLLLSAIIKAVDEYADLLRASIANTGNDHRLGANEAPPAIVSIFLGEQLTDILEQIEKGGVSKSKLATTVHLGTNRLPSLPKDTTDRNRTSPFAFTGNKFEFRMVGSLASIAPANTVLNTIVAESLRQFADRLETAKDLQSDINALILETIKKHKRVIFNGNNYAPEWVAEAGERGLPNITNTVDAISVMLDKKNVDVMNQHAVLNHVEMESRAEVQWEIYVKTINIEGLTMASMARRRILPAAIGYKASLAASIGSILEAGGDAEVEKALLNRAGKVLVSFNADLEKLEKAIETAAAADGGSREQAVAYRDLVFTAMADLRVNADTLETLVDADYWPMPTYSELLFNV